MNSYAVGWRATAVAWGTAVDWERGEMGQGNNQPLRWYRYEAKYLVSEGQAAEIQRICVDHLPPDPYASRGSRCEYPIASLYLDSRSRMLLRHTIERRVSRYKLRLRTYSERQESWEDQPAFVEIKRKKDGVVHKTRARVTPEMVESVLWEEASLLNGNGIHDAGTVRNVNEFLQLRSRIGALPVGGTFYTREAYEGVSADRIRITLDRDLHYGLLARPGNGATTTWWPVNPGGVVLEIKFTNSYPFWVANMLGRVEVLRRGVCKYVICSRAAGLSVEPTSGSGRHHSSSET
ncbi:MAG: polyphosphate polymerase domain-containing protein [Planctomycetes bacterium]|nr:polyphosphate polymerase domain-containing protein [Planctomycetota bacterium]